MSDYKVLIKYVFDRITKLALACAETKHRAHAWLGLIPTAVFQLLLRRYLRQEEGRANQGSYPS